MYRLWKGFVLLLLCCVTTSQCGRVLLAVHQVKSHVFEISQIGRGLLDLGHDVYMVATKPFKLDSLMKSYGIELLYFDRPAGTPTLDSDELEIRTTRTLIDRVDPGEMINDISATIMDQCFYMMQDEHFLDDVKKLKFHIVIYDAFTLSECLVILPYHLNIPYVWQFSDYHWNLPVLKLTPAFIPSMFTQYSDHMNIWQKLINIYSHYKELTYPVPADRNTTLLKRYGHGATTWTEVTSQSLLFLISRDFLLEWPRPTLPNTIYTPGLTQTYANPLPDDLETTIESSGKKVIVMSLGSIVQIELFPKHIINQFLEAFSTLPEYLFVCKFKFEDDDYVKRTYNLPQNVIFLKWMPQNDILGHPQTKLFLTHGGNNGQHEAMYHGVPMITFPLFGDQFKNAFRATHHNIGISMDIFNFKALDLVHNIKIILDEENDYVTNSEKLSKIAQSFPRKPRDTMAFWVDHVIKFGGDHLHSPSQIMSIFDA